MQMWFVTVNATGGAPPSAQTIYADAWKEVYVYFILDKKLLEGPALNEALRKFKQEVAELETKAKQTRDRVDQAPSGPFVGPSNLVSRDPLKQLLLLSRAKRGGMGVGTKKLKSLRSPKGFPVLPESRRRPHVTVSLASSLPSNLVRFDTCASRVRPAPRAFRQNHSSTAHQSIDTRSKTYHKVLAKRSVNECVCVYYCRTYYKAV